MKAHGKCIIAGEHTVLRGGKAIIFPVHHYGLRLQSTPHPSLKIILRGRPQQELQSFLEATFQKVPECWVIEGDLPLSAGLGGSAAVSIVIARQLGSQNLFRDAKIIEDFFHGISSGADIAGVLSDEPLVYSQAEGARPLSLKPSEHLGRWYLSDSGLRSKTRSSIQKAQRHLAIDQDMNEATGNVYHGLQNHDRDLVQKGVNQASDCFEAWGLCPDLLKKHMEDLRQRGALAVKPTGSGMGGFVVSLWDREPEIDLIPLWPCSVRP